MIIFLVILTISLWGAISWEHKRCIKKEDKIFSTCFNSNYKEMLGGQPGGNICKRN